MSATTGTQSEVLYTLPASVTKNNWSTIAAYTGVAGTNTVCKIPAGWAFNESPNPIGRTLRLKVFFSIANTAAATFANAINVNPAVATSTGNITINTAYTPTASVVARCYVDAWLEITAYATSTMTLQIDGEVLYMTIASGGAVSVAPSQQVFSGSIASLDPRVDQYVELFGTWSVANAANQTIVSQMILEGLN